MRNVASLLLLLTLASPVVFAQNEVAVIGGSSTESERSFAVTFNHFFSGGWGGEVGLFQTEQKFLLYEQLPYPTAVFVPPQQYEYTDDITSFSAAVQYQWNRDGRWQPYLGGGVIYGAFSDEVVANGYEDDESSITTFWSGGLTYAVSKELGIRLDARHGQQGWTGPVLMPNGVISLGARWRF